MSRQVGVALSDWGLRLKGYASDHVADVQVVLVRDRRAVTDRGLTVVCVQVGDPWVDRHFIAACDAEGLPIIGVYDSIDTEHEAIGLGIELRMDASTTPTRMMQQIATVDPAAKDVGLGDPVDFHAAPLQGRAALVVGGPIGTDATEVGVALAAVMSNDGSSILIDFNETDPHLAMRLGYCDVPNVATAAAAVSSNGEAAAHLSAPQPGLPQFDFDVICGLPSGDDWNKLGEHDSVRLLAECDRNWNSAVAITGPMVEDLDGWVPRFAVSRRLLSTADHVLGLCDASPVGIVRFASWLVHANPKAPVLTVISNVPAKSTKVVSDIAQRLQSLCGDRIQIVGSLPVDTRVGKAAWNAELVPRGPFSRAMVDISFHATDAMESAWRTEGAIR